MLRSGEVLKGNYVNPHSTSSLFSTKLLAKELGWDIETKPWTGRTTIKIRGVEMQAEEDGNLPYLPDCLAPVHPEV